MVALDAALRMEGIPALLLLEQFQDTLRGGQSGPSGKPDPRTGMLRNGDEEKKNISINNVDHKPHNVLARTNNAKLLIMEDNEAVIQMIKMRHVSRTHRVSSDWLFKRLDRTKYEGTYL